MSSLDKKTIKYFESGFFQHKWYFDLKKVHLLSLRLGVNSVVEWHKPKLNVAQLQKKPHELEKEMQLPKKVLELKRGNVRTYFLFFNWNNYDRKM
jgi:hypothetical protein